MEISGAHPSYFSLLATSMQRKNILRLLAGLLAVLAIAAASIGWPYYRSIYVEGVPSKLNDPFVHIPSQSTFEDVVYILKHGNYITDEASFRWVAGQMSYAKPVMRAGRFELTPGWSNRELIQHLRTGEQAPVKVVLSSERLPEDIAGKVARFLEADSMALLEAFRNPALLQELGYSAETVTALFVPNTYAMFWNTEPVAFLRRMQKEHKAFWDKNDRRAKANALGLSPLEAYT
jgi:UPF0755 protein